MCRKDLVEVNPGLREGKRGRSRIYEQKAIALAVHPVRPEQPRHRHRHRHMLGWKRGRNKPAWLTMQEQRARKGTGKKHVTSLDLISSIRGGRD